MSESERYLLDTSAVIDLPSPAQIRSDAEYLISSITLAELNAGIHAAKGPVHRADRLARLQWVSDTFDPLPFTVGAARMYGQLLNTGPRGWAQPPAAPDGSAHRLRRGTPPPAVADPQPC